MCLVCCLLLRTCLLFFVSPQSLLAKRKFLQSAVSAPANFLAFGLATALAFWLLCFGGPTASAAAAAADIFACCLFLLRALWLCFVLRVHMVLFSFDVFVACVGCRCRSLLRRLRGSLSSKGRKPLLGAELRPKPRNAFPDLTLHLCF